MQIITTKAGKQFGREWIFKNLNFSFQQNQSYAIIGHNGSGKSTLLKILAGAMPTTAGEVSYTIENKIIPLEEWFKHIAISAPYLELIEEFSLQETIDFYIQFKKLLITKKELLARLALEKSLYKPIKFFSSGMKQKVKLALALYTDVKVLFLDEPTATLDEKNTLWYVENIQQVLTDKIVIICSNQPHEYNFCDVTINLMDFK